MKLPIYSEDSSLSMERLFLPSFYYLCPLLSVCTLVVRSFHPSMNCRSCIGRSFHLVHIFTINCSQKRLWRSGPGDGTMVQRCCLDATGWFHHATTHMVIPHSSHPIGQSPSLDRVEFIASVINFMFSNFQVECLLASAQHVIIIMFNTKYIADTEFECCSAARACAIRGDVCSFICI
jgi:hypothetical protein